VFEAFFAPSLLHCWQNRRSIMTKDNVFKKIDERVKKLIREYDKIPLEDSRRVDLKNEISALYLEQHNLKK
jgi:uncharacterized protein (DUF1919 family)